MQVHVRHLAHVQVKGQPEAQAIVFILLKTKSLLSII